MMMVLYTGSTGRGAKPQPRYNRIHAMNDRVVMRLQYRHGNISLLFISFQHVRRRRTERRTTEVDSVFQRRHGHNFCDGEQ